jgi:tetratricopeptide (TPR) repeat protein
MSKTPTLCLNMIVKNESKIITRMFDSIVSIIDCYCICDTGSTDNTIEVITSYFESKNIPGKIVCEPFKDFCYNRNFALQSCVNMSDYVLLMDADMMLEVKNFDKMILNIASTFNILQGNDSFYYQNIRILKNNGLYKYVGVTHEYIDTPPNSTLYAFEKNQLFIRDIGDGGCKQNKFERDISLLLNGIKEEPNNVRYYFYLANSYHDSGRFGEAINAYKKRIEMGGWREEVWYSYYRIGLCFKNMGKIKDAIHYWLEGYNFYPERLEGLYEIIQHYRIDFKPKLAEMYYNIAKKILELNHRRDDYLFLHEDIYSNRIYYEYTIFASYLGINNINDEVVKILNNSKIGHEVDNLLSNMKFYKYILTPSSRIIFDDINSAIINNDATKFYSSSSCLLPVNESNPVKYIMNVRYVNYYITDQGYYLDCDKHIITINKFVELDKNLNIICEKWQNLKFEDRRYIGIEDVRVFHDIETKKQLFLGTGFHKNDQIGIVMGNYEPKIVDPTFVMDSIEVRSNFNNSSCEKNWVFVNYEGSTHIVYDWHPMRICKMNYETNELHLVKTKPLPQIFSRARGSTSGFTYVQDSEIWFVQHIVSYESPRHYYHMISVFDLSMNLLRYSAPFKFEGEPIEYCLSIVVESDRVLINYSTWDRTTRIGVYEKKYIDSLVKYLH